MPTGRDIRAKNELFARRARDTQNLRGARHNARGLVHTEDDDARPKTPLATKAIALFFLSILLGGGAYLLTVVMELVYLFFRSS